MTEDMLMQSFRLMLSYADQLERHMANQQVQPELFQRLAGEYNACLTDLGYLRSALMSRWSVGRLPATPNALPNTVASLSVGHLP